MIPQRKRGSHADAISIAYLKQKRKTCADEKDSPPEKAVFYDYGVSHYFRLRIGSIVFFSSAVKMPSFAVIVKRR